eukprot:scaffold83934_cov66-Phaeocystis_antarctica.AAC.5
MSYIHAYSAATYTPPTWGGAVPRWPTVRPVQPSTSSIHILSTALHILSYPNPIPGASPAFYRASSRRPHPPPPHASP